MLPGFSTCSYTTINNSGKDFKVGSSLDVPAIGKLGKCLGSFKSLFIDEFEEISVTNAGVCFVKTKSSTPISCQSNKLTRKQNEMLCEKVSELLRKGIIQHSNSDWCSNAYVKENPDNGKLELRVNYAKLNENLEDMDLYLLSIEEDRRSYEEASIFSKVVIKDGFYQVPMNPKDKKKTAFKTELGQFEFNVMPYQMKNSDKVFHKILEKVLGYNDSIKWQSNEILVPTGDDLDGHLEVLKRLFKKLQTANFKIDLNESCFCVDEVSFGGYQLSERGFTICPDVVEKIRTSKAPKNATEMNAFLELTKPYATMMSNYSLYVAPLKALITNSTLIWNKKAVTAFKQLIVGLMNAPPVAFYRDGGNLQLRCDVRPEGCSCVLEQESYSGAWRPVAFCSSYRETVDGSSCRFEERDAVMMAIDEFQTLVEADYVSVLIGHSSFDFLHFPDHKLVDGMDTAHLLCYKYKLEENDNFQLKHDPNSKHEPGTNCFDQTADEDSEDDALNRLYFSDSD